MYIYSGVGVVCAYIYLSICYKLKISENKIYTKFT